MSRRLPVYLLLDCSESMAGSAIEEVSRGVDNLVTALQSNPLALETAYLSVITFSRYARQDVPLTEILQFKRPKLAIRPGTALGAALQVLLKCLQKEVVKTTPTTKGDYKPLVFLLTDGQSTDDWESAATALRRANQPKIANIYAIGVGPDVDTDCLHQITDIVLTIKDANTEALKKMFVWLSASVQSASVKFNEGPAAGPIEMPPLPESLQFHDPSTPSRHEETPRQVFLQARCSRTKQPYLMRFARQEYAGHYEAIASHKLETLEAGDDELLPPINSSLLDGCPGCPYCENPVAALCPCGALFCDQPGSTGPVTCPACSRVLTGNSNSGSFDIQRSAG